jgi:predicted ATP-dependent serine protease
MILLVGPPGSGKSTFCQQAILQNLALGRPIICVTTECGPSEAEKALKEQGLGKVEPGLLNYVYSYNETVGARALFAVGSHSTCLLVVLVSTPFGFKTHRTRFCIAIPFM